MSALSLPVIPLTISVSLCLVFTFVLFFLREQTRRFGNAERESLLPLAEETPRLAGGAGRGRQPSRLQLPLPPPRALPGLRSTRRCAAACP